MHHRDLVGRRIEIPVYYDVRVKVGERFGTVTVFRYGKVGQSDYVFVRMDHPGIKQAIKLWRPDWEYCKILE